MNRLGTLALLVTAFISTTHLALAAPATTAGLPAASPYVAAQWRQFDLASQSTGRSYRIFLSLPATPPPAEGYPVIYVTDGNAYFPMMAEVANGTSFANGVAPAIVVGIGYPVADMSWLRLRYRDLTSAQPAPADLTPGEPRSEQDYGGADAFLGFLVDELRPMLASAYKINPGKQALFGHSLGGLFALEVMFKHPDAFQSYLIASPSIWFADRAVLNAEAGFVRAVEAGHAAVRAQITIGQRESDPPKRLPPGFPPELAAKRVKDARMVGNVTDLGERLAKLNGKGGFEVRTHVFEGEDHISVVPAAISRGVNFTMVPD